MNSLPEFELIDCDTHGAIKPLPCTKIDKNFFEVSQVIVNGYICDDVWKVENKIGEESSTGNVYLTCCSSKCNYVLKQVEFNRPLQQIKQGYINTTKESFLNEVRIQITASMHNIAPRIHQVFINRENGAFIMDSMKSATARRTIIDIMDSNMNHDNKIDAIKNILNKLYVLIKTLHRVGIYHGDTHLNNFMKKNINDPDWMIIDFGTSTMNWNENMAIEDYIHIYTDINHLITEKNVYKKYLDMQLKSLETKIGTMKVDVEEVESEREKIFITKAKLKVSEYEKMLEDNSTPENFINLINKSIKTIKKGLQNLIEDSTITSKNNEIVDNIVNNLKNLKRIGEKLESA